jgi:hypothetical protein
MDEHISKFINDWYCEFPKDYKSALKISLTKNILSNISPEKAGKQDKKTPMFTYRNSGNLFLSITKGIWFILWFVKWMLFYNRKTDKKKIIVAIGSNLSNTQNYLNQLYEIAKKNKFQIILLNLVESYYFLKKDSIYYYPRFIYNKKDDNLRGNEHLLLTEVFMDVRKAISKSFMQFSNNNKSLKTSLKNLIKDYDSYYYLVEKIITPSKIVALIQDYDYTYNKFLYFYISNQKKIRTIALDTSIVLYEHQYKKVFSSYHLVWGQHKKDFILANNKIHPSKIIITGNPNFKNDFICHKNPNCNLWLYIAQSYTEPSMFTRGRNFGYLQSNLIKLKKIQNNEFPNDEIILRIHPSDNPSQFNFGVKKSFNDSLDSYLNRAKIIFTEDTTLALELFVLDYQIIYVLDQFNNDNIGLVKQNLVQSINSNEFTTDEIKKIVNSDFHIDSEKIKEIKNYYFGNYTTDTFYSTLKTVLYDKN